MVKSDMEKEPDWAHRARHIEHKPEWQDTIPHELWKLGEVFFPIPLAKKGWNYPHHLDEYRYSADDEVINAYLEAGFGYGIACAGSLAVVDVDDLNYLDDISEKLPETAWQLSGSREGVHLFYFVEGLETRITLHKEFLDEWIHIGEVKCDPHGYVVGPGSVHPSGNEYGPLQGGSITSISEEKLRDAVDEFIKPEPDTEQYRDGDIDYDDDLDRDVHGLYELTADDVLPWLEPDNKVAHPVHGSSTGRNFQKNDDRETFTCWRCQHGPGSGCGLNGTQFLAVEATGRDCDEIRMLWYRDTSIHYRAWRRAVEEGLIGYQDIPYKAAHGYAVEQGLIEGDEKLSGGLYHDVVNAMRYEAQMEEVLP